MFYKQKDVKETITCQLCKEIFQDPRLLPCGETACRECIQKIVELGGVEEFECRLCVQKHQKMINKEYPLNRALLKLIKTQASDVSRNAIVNEFKTKRAKIRQMHDEFKLNLEIGVDQVREHCIRIRNQVHLETEILIEDVHRFNEELIAEIDKYEHDRIASFNNKITEYKSKIEETLVEIDHFYENDDDFLTEFVVDDKMVVDSISKVDPFLQKLSTRYNLLKSMAFNQQIIEFKKNQSKPDKSVIGKLCYESIGFKKLKVLTFNDQILRNSEKKFNLMKLDNGLNVAFFIDTKSKLSMSLFDETGVLISKMDNITNNHLVDDVKVACFNTSFLFYIDFKSKDVASWTFNGSSSLSSYCESSGARTYYALILADENLTCLAHAPITNIKCIATNRTNILLINEDNCYYYYDSKFNVILNDSSFVNIKHQIGDSLVNLAMNDKYLFFLCNT
jgi:hypothetical protein